MQQAGDHIVHVVSSAARISGRPYLKVKQFVQEASQKKKEADESETTDPSFTWVCQSKPYKGAWCKASASVSLKKKPHASTSIQGLEAIEMSEEVINLEMEFPGRETSLSPQLPTSALAANEHAPNPNPKETMELEMAAGDYRNGAPDAQEAGEDMLLDGGKLGALKRREFFDNLLKRVEDDNLHFLQRQKQRIERQALISLLL